MQPRNPFLSPQSTALAILAFAVGLLCLAQPQAKATAPLTPVPAALGEWVGTPLAVESRVVQILETDDVDLMEYKLGEEPPVWLARVSGFDNRAAFHPPEICYVGSHFEVLERGPITVAVNGRPRRLMRLVIGQDTQRFEAWYWFTAGGRVTPSYYQQQVWLMLDVLHRRPMSGTLVRISTQIDEPAKTHERLLAFVTAWDAAHQS